jgi:hypothetical protein
LPRPLRGWTATSILAIAAATCSGSSCTGPYGSSSRNLERRGHLPHAPGRAGIVYLGSSEIGYSLRVRGLLGAGSRSALPPRFPVIVEYGGLIP